MDKYRNDTFKKKFATAAKHFGVTPDKIVSLKFRENVASYADYKELIRMLEQEFGIRSAPVDGDLQGRGYLLADGASRVILVEHESGLELLYIAGSIASLVSLIPITLQGWRAVRGWYERRQDAGIRDAEVRRLDEKGNLIEERVHDIGIPNSALNRILASAAKIAEKDLLDLQEQVRTLAVRVEVLEKHSAKASKQRKKPGSGRK